MLHEKRLPQDSKGVPIQNFKNAMGYVGKTAGVRDFTITFTSATVLTLSGYPTGITSFNKLDIESIQQFDGNKLQRIYTNIDDLINVSGDTVVVENGEFVDGHSYVITTNASRPLSTNTVGYGNTLNSYSFQIATGTNDKNILVDIANSFAKTPVSKIRLITDRTISLKFNSASNVATTIDATESPFIMQDWLIFTNLFISNNSGDVANIKIMTS